MIFGIKDLTKLFAITVVTCCATFICSLFLNYNMDVVRIKDKITTEQGMIMYEAQITAGKFVVIVAGACLVATTIVLLIFYVKNYIDSHGKELGILKAIGYSNFNIAKHFWVFGLSVFLGSLLGFLGAVCYMPSFYETQNAEGLLPELSPQLNPLLTLSLLALPTTLFALLSVLYAFFKLRKPVLVLLREIQKINYRIGKRETKEYPFLSDLRKSTLRSRRILVFFVGFSAFCFSAMVQMSMSMDDFASESFSWMMITIGLTLAFMTLLMSLTSVIKANTKTIAMMKAFGYSEQECSASILGGYRPVSYIGFAIGTVYQYILLRVMVSLVFSDFAQIPEYSFDFKALVVTLVLFLVVYEVITYCYSKKLGKQSVKAIMME